MTKIERVRHLSDVQSEHGLDRIRSEMERKDELIETVKHLLQTWEETSRRTGQEIRDTVGQTTVEASDRITSVSTELMSTIQTVRETLEEIIEQAATSTSDRIAEASSPMTAALDTLAQSLVSLSEELQGTVRAIQQALAQAREAVEEDMTAAVQRAEDLLTRVAQTVEASTAAASKAAERLEASAKAAESAAWHIQTQSTRLRWWVGAWTGAAALIVGAALPIALEIWQPRLLVGLWHLAMAVHGSH